MPRRALALGPRRTVAQHIHQFPHRCQILETIDRRDHLVDAGGRYPILGVDAEFVLDLRA
jgi:hypothetical protein